MKSKGTISFREKTKARLRTELPVPKEKKLARKLEDLTIEAEALATEGNELSEKVKSYSTRASTTLPPATPPPQRDPLFQAPKDGQPSQYETQLKAYELLLEDWKGYRLEVKEYEKQLSTFGKCFETARKRHGTKAGKAFDDTDHEFESLANALHNLQEQRAKLDRDVAEVALPVDKKGK